MSQDVQNVIFLTIKDLRPECIDSVKKMLDSDNIDKKLIINSLFEYLRRDIHYIPTVFFTDDKHERYIVLQARFDYKFV